jgi:hypothetical protein
MTYIGLFFCERFWIRFVLCPSDSFWISKNWWNRNKIWMPIW